MCRVSRPSGSFPFMKLTFPLPVQHPEKSSARPGKVFRKTRKNLPQDLEKSSARLWRVFRNRSVHAPSSPPSDCADAQPDIAGISFAFLIQHRLQAINRSANITVKNKKEGRELRQICRSSLPEPRSIETVSRQQPAKRLSNRYIPPVISQNGKYVCHAARRHSPVARNWN